MAPPTAAAMQATISNVHLCLAQKACFFTLLAWIESEIRFFWFIRRLYPVFGSSSPTFPLSTRAEALFRCFRSLCPVNSPVAAPVPLFYLGPCCCWRRSACNITYELLLVNLRESSIHLKGPSSRDFTRREFFLESFLDLIEKNDGSFDFERAFSEANIEDVLILDKVVIIPA